MESFAGTFLYRYFSRKAERRRMAQVNVIGRITADLELKTSEKSNPYVRFDIAENIGSRQTLHICRENGDSKCGMDPTRRVR